MKFIVNLLSWSLLIVFVLTSCDITKKNSVTVAGSENQWPMSGGPDGSWKIQTKLPVPTKWSVRTGENIKWKKTLPEGGQSGIAVWDDKIFFTINPPTNTPKYSDVLIQLNNAKKEYEALFSETEDVLRQKHDDNFILLEKEFKKSKSRWNAFLENSDEYKSANEIRKKAISNALKRREETGKSYTKIEKNYNTYICSKSDALEKANLKLLEVTKALKGGAQSKDIVLYCMDANTGETLWKKNVEGTIETEYNYGFSDGTTPTPMTDGNHVWAINACGGMACFTLNGDVVWHRKWMPIPVTKGRPFNKQFDSVLFEDLILNVEPASVNDSTKVEGWNYLHAFNKNTGKLAWISDAAITNYNTPILGETKEGKPAILIGRGGPHKVPERPVGLSLISLEKEKQGTSLWTWEPSEPNKISGLGSLSTQHWDAEKASWFYGGNAHLTINTTTGLLIDKKPLNVVDQLKYDTIKKDYVLNKDFEIKDFSNNYHYQYHCNISSGDNIFYMGLYQPFISRHNVISGNTEYIEVPEEIANDGSFIWDIRQSNDGLNAQGQLNAFDARTRGGGFQKCFLGSPTMINNYIYFTNAVGIVYVIDANSEKFDESAIIAINDLGEKGTTWTVNSLSFANGNIYHRTMKEIICIGKN